MTQNQVEPYGRLSPKEANERVTTGALKIVDVRENWEYARDHIPSATLTPLEQIIARPQDEINSDNVIFVCEDGPRSQEAAEMAAAPLEQQYFPLGGGTH